MRTRGPEASKAGLRWYAFDGLYLNLTIYRNAEAAVRGLKADVLKALSDEEKKSWEDLATKTVVTRKDDEEHLGIGARKAQRHLKRFVELGLLRKVGASSSTEYQVRKP